MDLVKSLKSIIEAATYKTIFDIYNTDDFVDRSKTVQSVALFKV